MLVPDIWVCSLLWSICICASGGQLKLTALRKRVSFERVFQHCDKPWRLTASVYTSSSHLVADIHVRGASLLAAAPVAVALAVLDVDAGHLAGGGRVHELVHQGRDGRVQHEGDQEEEGEDADDAHRAQDQAGVVLDVLQAGPGVVSLGVHVFVLVLLGAGLVLGVGAGRLERKMADALVFDGKILLANNIPCPMNKMAANSNFART